MSRTQADLLVVGGGIIGLSVARRARRQGLSVLLLERGEAGRATSHVAAGMLAPVAEVEFGESGRRLLELGLRSAELWPAFAAELEAQTAIDVGLLRTGTLLLARDEDDARELERQLALRESLRLPVRRLRPSEARALEPALAPTLRMALELPGDHSVDPRRVLAALLASCRADGVEVRERSEVESVLVEGGRVRGAALAGGELIGAPRVVLAPGPWSAELGGLPAPARIPVRPVRGQILRLRDASGPGLLGRVLRFAGGYLLPRGDGRYVLGATVEERGFRERPTVGGVHELLRRAGELVPGVGELEIDELSVGFRPGTPDNLPAIGRCAVEGLLWAAGHHRNGILLAPLTAELVAEALDPGTAGELAPLLAACSPARFARDEAATPAGVA